MTSNNVIPEANYVDKQKVDMFIMSNQKYFPSDKIIFLKEKLYRMDESRFSMVSTVDFKEPTTMLIISLFLGSLGVDRFMLGETGAGVLKLLTGGCCGILTLIDWFSVQKKAKELNFKNIMTLI
ncbi:MAG: TM2 domain-containing protein [Clostridia bacterium]|nr:TM2 domain-containing protein [Clostridia bacterium]